ncbi:hypothetical protein PR202_ga07783 [Eleusine coracana subsp. coracana]|uniref:Peptidase C1A papain C-terminal domain-containing protein n=1 Tax=Eleusine coracana subsp. coracana TaxID=191504 RepID=A0AAV5C0V7_ELECO|nr:hypothetical protein QOZ80_2AG0116140 [Eleusine coracana subsp. coracana]GJM91418.1 hypothetical protein PR202_ga07783 [Eleusine coracana subsp. coracana]
MAAAGKAVRMAAMAMIMALALAAPAAMAMEFTRADLASENATWALYHRWSARYYVVRMASDKARRFGIFKDNLLRAVNDSTPGINGFGDLTDDELAEVYNCAIPNLAEVYATSNITPEPSVIGWFHNLPDTVDWTYGWTRSALSYVWNNGGLAPESVYPYKAQQGPCQKVVSPLIPIAGYSNVPPNDELELRRAVAGQPVVVNIDASGEAFKRYDGGLFRGPCNNDGYGHAITVVGYGSDPITHEPYWILKNSWSETWGENGYMKMQREIHSMGTGLCGIHKSPTYPYRV